MQYVLYIQLDITVRKSGADSLSKACSKPSYLNVVRFAGFFNNVICSANNAPLSSVA